MSSPSPSSVAPQAPNDAPGAVVDLLARHRQLRARWRWLLPVVAALLFALRKRNQLVDKRAALTGYRYQQVGVQPDSTWWILAYRNGRAEILFSRDTARGWQRRELGTDSAQARSLALNWGGKALLVGDGGAVRVYDARFQLMDSVRYPLGKDFRARWVAADNSGQRAVVLSTSGAALYSADGGQTWQARVATAGLLLQKRTQPEYWRERAGFGPNNELDLASRFDFIRASTGAPLSYLPGVRWNTVSYIPPAKAGARVWAPPTDSVPIIYFRLNALGMPQILRQDGSAKTPARHYPAAELAGTFPAEFKPIDAAFSPSRPGFCLLISRTRVFAGQLGGPFAALQPAVPADSITAGKTPAAPAQTAPGTGIKNPGKTKLTNVRKTNAAAGVTPQKSTSKTKYAPTKGPKENGDNTNASGQPGQQRPEQTALPANSPIQQTTPPASNKKAPNTREDARQKPESAN